MGETKKIEGLQSQLKEAEEKLSKTFKEKEALRKAIWDMLNYANIFVVLLDSEMNIVLINYSLATKLGFKDETEAIGRCWLDFIKPEEHDQLTTIHHSLAYEGDHEKYREVINDIVKLSGDTCTIKWFNFTVNSDYHLTFSLGIPKEFPIQVTEESVRSYYKDVLAKDRTTIDSLRDMIVKGTKTPDFCKTELGGKFYGE